jgi:TRAP-type transport system periplasmic protein
MTMRTLNQFAGAFVAGMVFVGLGAAPAASQTKTLRAVSCFPEGSYSSSRFEQFIKAANEQTRGSIDIVYQGGAPAIGSPLSVVQRLSSGVYDLVNCAGAYYQNVLPEADAWKLQERPTAEIRTNGGWELMQRLHREKNLVLLARPYFGTPFHLYLGAGKKISKADLTGLHLRSSPLYLTFFKSLGATTQNSDLAQIYALMENGTVHGYGWSASGMPPGLERVTKYRVDPGFYNGDVLIIANAASWEAVPEKARESILAAALRIEATGVQQEVEDVKAAIAKQQEQGIEAITLGGEDAKKWLAAAREGGWSSVLAASPQHGPQLRKAFAAE